MLRYLQLPDRIRVWSCTRTKGVKAKLQHSEVVVLTSFWEKGEDKKSLSLRNKEKKDKYGDSIKCTAKRR